MNGELDHSLPLTSAATTAAAVSAASTRSLQFSALARDVLTMGGGTVLAAVFNTALVFLIPPILSVEDFGYWRLFLLYVGYTGFLHLGFSDGALLRWAGKPLSQFHHEIAGSLNFLFWQILLLVIPGCVLVLLFVPQRLKIIGIATLVYALIMNLSALLQYCLQAARQFRPVAVGTVAPTAVFLFFALLLHAFRAASFRALIICYCVAWAGALAYLWLCVRPLESHGRKARSLALGKVCIRLGWPVVLANGGFLLVQSADRLAISSVLPIYDFAIYSLASSMMFVPVTGIAAIYRVFFSHVASVEHEGRSKVYAHASKFLLLAWSILLPYYFLLEIIVRKFLHKYIEALPAARILLLGVIFLAGIQILHMSFAYIYEKQRGFLLVTGGALALSFSLGLLAAYFYHSLMIVAAGQVATLAIWWLVNEWSLRKITGQGWRDWLVILVTFLWSTAAFALARFYTPNPGFRILIYYAILSACLFITCRPELRIARNLMTRWRVTAPRGSEA